MDTGVDDRTRRYVEALDGRRRSLADEVEDDVAPVRALTMRQRGEWIASVCRSAWDILRSRRDGRRVIEEIEPPVADFPAKWAALMADRRRRTAPGA